MSGCVSCENTGRRLLGKQAKRVEIAPEGVDKVGNTGIGTKYTYELISILGSITYALGGLE